VSQADIDDALRERLHEVCAAGWDFFEHFDRTVRERGFHPFIASEYEVVLTALAAHRAPGRRFLELGSASGVITIMADMLGYEAYGIELDLSLVATAREMAARFGSSARFVNGSFFPTGFRFHSPSGDLRTGTLGEGTSGYLELGLALDDFDIVFGYPWGGEEPVLLDLMKRYGNPDAVLLMHGVNDGVQAYRNGKRIP
jgi:peptidoglycan/xylan/chitin deacetylase (PgdA/CDA1 family)